MKLSILDQSPVISGHSAAQAVEATIMLARRADELGYHRYWLAEHHAIAALADPCPAILLARLGAETRRIRIGAGGVLGSPESCKEKLLDLAGRSSADELMVLTITGDCATRLESYELLATAFEFAGARASA